MPRLTEGVLLSHPELVGEGENNSNVAIKNPAAIYFDWRLSFSRVDYLDWILSYLPHKLTWWTQWWGWGRARSTPWSGPESTWCSSSGLASNLDQVWYSLCLKLPSVIMVASNTSHCLWKGVQRWASSESLQGERWPGGCTCDRGSWKTTGMFVSTMFLVKEGLWAIALSIGTLHLSLLIRGGVLRSQLPIFK